MNITYELHHSSIYQSEKHEHYYFSIYQAGKRRIAYIYRKEASFNRWVLRVVVAILYQSLLNMHALKQAQLNKQRFVTQVLRW